MATSIAAPNLHRFVLPDIHIDRDNSGIIDLIDEVVERVMRAHTKKSRPVDLDFASQEEAVVSLLSLHSAYQPADSDQAAA